MKINKLHKAQEGSAPPTVIPRQHIVEINKSLENEMRAVNTTFQKMQKVSIEKASRVMLNA